MAGVKCSSRYETVVARFCWFPFLLGLTAASIGFFWHHDLPIGFACAGGSVLLFFQYWLIARRTVFVCFDDVWLSFTDWLRHDAIKWQDIKEVQRTGGRPGFTYLLKLRRRTVFGKWVFMVTPNCRSCREAFMNEFRSRVKVDEDPWIKWFCSTNTP